MVIYLKNNNTFSTYQLLLGNAAWERLATPIQRRFDTNASHLPAVYHGTMNFKRSRAGKFFALLTKIIGNPLTPYRGENIPVVVSLLPCPQQSGIIWEREYHFPNKKPEIIRSIKRKDHRNKLSEHVGAGFFMGLNVFEKNGNLHFKSTRYYWRCFFLTIPIPHWLTPGETHVIHEHIDDNYFRFSLRMHHPQLGTTFAQEGIFYDNWQAPSQATKEQADLAAIIEL